MDQIFICSNGSLRARWKQAFPKARAVNDVRQLASDTECANSIVWLDITGWEAAPLHSRVREVLALGSRVIAMTARPRESEAFQMLNLGVVGYCHLEAAPEQLREVALVVEHGGLWMLPELVQRLMSLSLRVVSTPPPERPELDALTARELMVAEQVAHGASNQEIAAALDISERTVKAHLSAAFDKLGVRDRVQLALAMNNIPTYTSVN